MENKKLTAMDVRALREADWVVARYTYIDLKHTLECIKKLKKNGPFDDDEKSYEITVAGLVANYGDNARSCIATMHDYSLEWKTVASLLKAGDELRLRWRTNNNEYMREAGLFRDELVLHVHRGDKELVFVIASCMCPDNTARMIKSVGMPV